MAASPDAPHGPRLSRRRFLASSATAGAGAVIASVGGGVLGAAGLLPGVVTPTADAQAQPVDPPTVIPFEGIHQAGIERPGIAQPDSIIASFDVVGQGEELLRSTLIELTRRIRELTRGEPAAPRDPSFPPPESGILGPSIGPSSLSVLVGVGASLFDDRFGIADRRPRQLRRMPHFQGDVLDPARSHGDVIIQACGVDAMACVHAVRYLMAGTRSALALRWMETGFHRPDTIPTPGKTTVRNLLGFKDGTANLVPGSDLFGERVWVTDADGEPAWATGGSYMAVRLIRMFVERWDRAPLAEQETIIGRSKRTGAPLGGHREEDLPDYTADPDGTMTALDAHIRLANPRSAGTERNLMFRRGYSFARGFDGAGLLDQGLMFIAFQRDLDAGFVTVQDRLAFEPLQEYIQPQGGGFFFALPGVVRPDGYLGDTLLG
jgi:deferrochelatase/peroxidase EfeB